MRLVPTLFFAAMTGCVTDYELNAEPVNVDPGEVTDCGFTQVESTDFYRYDCNPVFTTTDESWAGNIDSTAFLATEVLGHPFYQMWYTGVPAGLDAYGDFGLGYGVSANGTNWEVHPNNPLLEEPAPNQWDADAMDAMQVVWDPNDLRYVMIYQGYNLNRSDWGLGVATSDDGLVWTRSANNPVLDLTAPTGNVMGYCWPLGLSLGSVVGYTGYVAGYDQMDGACEVYTIDAGSVDTWTPNQQVVLPAGQPFDWDSQGFLSTAITALEGQNYMFFSGFGGWENHGTYRSTKNQFFSFAKQSATGGWEKHGEIIPLHLDPQGYIGFVAAQTVGDRIHLWVQDIYDGNYAVGYFLYDPNREATEAAE